MNKLIEVENVSNERVKDVQFSLMESSSLISCTFKSSK